MCWDVRPACICAWQSVEAGGEGCMKAVAAGGDTQCQESSERQRERGQQRMPPWPIVWKGDSGA